MYDAFVNGHGMLFPRFDLFLIYSKGAAHVFVVSKPARNALFRQEGRSSPVMSQTGASPLSHDLDGILREMAALGLETVLS
jgi:hypothetical protein